MITHTILEASIPRAPGKWYKLPARIFSGAFLLAIAPSVVNVNADQPACWTPGLMMQCKRIIGTAVSPDGKLVAYTVSEAVMEGEKSENLSHVWVASSDGRMNRQFTRGEKSCGTPAFSPDGKYLSFLSSRGDDGKRQVWTLPLDGGEAEPATSAKSGVSDYLWSPDGKRIAYTMVDPDTPEEEKNRKEKRDMTVVDAVQRHAHLYTVTMKPGGGRNPLRLTSGSFHVTAFDWSPDGKTIVFSRQAIPSPDVWPTSDLATVPSDSGEVKPLVTLKGGDFHPRFSPDGKWVAFLSDGGDPKWGLYYYYYLMAAPAGGGEPRKLTAEPLCATGGMIGWSSDSGEAYVLGVSRTSNRIFAVPLSGGGPRVISPGPGTCSDPSMAENGTVLAWVGQASEIPPEVYLSAPRPANPRRLTDVHADFPVLPYGKTEVIVWKSKDGMEIEGLLTYPVGYEKGKRYPLVLNVHGGPMGSFSETYTAAGGVYPIQAFAQDGYAFLRPNPRGSNGYGRKFALANYDDWGYGDYEDLIAGVDHVIAMGVAHPDSLCVMGWSYGGFMTSMVIAKTKRFKAASVGAGVTNLMSFTGTSDIPSFLPDYFGGEFWDRLDTYMKHSAMFNIKEASTPTLILHGSEDVRVPLSQGKELYNALKRQGRPVEMVIYPRMGHSISEPKFVEDIGNRELEWCNRHLRKR